MHGQVAGVHTLLHAQHGLDDVIIFAVQLPQQAPGSGSQPGACPGSLPTQPIWNAAVLPWLTLVLT